MVGLCGLGKGGSYLLSEVVVVVWFELDEGRLEVGGDIVLVEEDLFVLNVESGVVVHEVFCDLVKGLHVKRYLVNQFADWQNIMSESLDGTIGEGNSHGTWDPVLVFLGFLF